MTLPQGLFVPLDILDMDNLFHLVAILQNGHVEAFWLSLLDGFYFLVEFHETLRKALQLLVFHLVESNGDLGHLEF